MDWYKRDPVDFLNGVQGMSPELIGTYAVLIDLFYSRGGGTRRDDRHLAGLMGCSVRLARSLTDRLIELGKIEVDGEFITNSRAKREAKQARNTGEARAKAQRTRRERESIDRENNGLPDKHIPLEAIPEKRREEKSIREEPKGSLSPAVDEIAEAVQAYNDVAKVVGWPIVQIVSKARRAALKARLAECAGVPGWRDALAKARASPLLTGQNDRGWRADFDFLTRQSAFAKLMEGSYDPRPRPPSGPAPRPGNRADPALEQIARLAGLGPSQGTGRA
ncbi:MAG: YdaU family protein [Rhodobacteraceae bacterium]|jgi:uncharacterized protein YdaU (DUF1376 family)|nr:YdaU family protein [Paracoccaceae bacterium]